METYLTAGRLGGTAAALIALAGVVLGVRALRRPTGRGSTLTLIAGVIGLAGGGVVLAVADGGPGTGNGVVGGGAAVVLGLAASGLGGLVRLRAWRAAAAPPSRSA